MELLGLGRRADLGTSAGRAAARDDIDDAMAAFCASRTLDEVVAAFDEASAAAAPVYDMADVYADPHVRARELIVEVDGIPMQGLLRPAVGHAGRDPLGRTRPRRRRAPLGRHAPALA